MPNLRVLTLQRCGVLDSHLRWLAVALPKSLCRLVLQLHSISSISASASVWVPTVPVLSFLLCKSAKLHLDLELTAPPTVQASHTELEFLTQLRSAWLQDACLQSFGDRVRII